MWIAKDKDGIVDCITLFINKPECINNVWWPNDPAGSFMAIPNEMFPDLTFENNPQEVKLIRE